MILNFDFASNVPLYMQLRNQVVIGIAEGKLLPGEKLPTIRALAEESGINMMTVSKAYQLLKQEGYIYTDRRNGAKVRERLEFSGELPQETKEMLQRVISEAKVRGISQEEFQQICEEYF
jgi:GntR family transcriptional regulator